MISLTGSLIAAVVLTGTFPISRPRSIRREIPGRMHRPPPPRRSAVSRSVHPVPRHGARTIAPHPTASDPITRKPTSTKHPEESCEEIREHQKFLVYFHDVDISKLVQAAADTTCKTFILPENVRGKISIVGPENGKGEVSAHEFYAAFLAALDANNLAVYPYGKFLKIVQKREAKQSPIPLVRGNDDTYTRTEQMITKLFHLEYVDADQMRGLLQQLVSKNGSVIAFPPDTLIVNDTGDNMHRIDAIVDQLDQRSSSDELHVITVKYASVKDVAATLQKLFENQGGSNKTPARRTYPRRPGTPANAQNQGGGPVTVSQIIPDERTNQLIVVASPAAFERIHEILRQVDVPVAGEGKINVYYLENANATDLASTLQGLTQGSAQNARTPRPATAGASATELFSGAVKISPDKATNSLVIVANQADYKNLVRVIQKLDIRQRQVFVEAVIMEVDLDRNSDFGINLHQGFSLRTPEGASTGIAGTQYAKGSLPPSLSLANLASFGGFLAGLQGPNIPALANLGVNIPSFGILIHALQQSSDVNVLSTPHILTTNNEEAEIVVGQNVPFQAGFNPSTLGASLGSAASTTSTTGTSALSGILGGLGGLGGLGSFYAPITRQNVELKLTIKPHINDSDYIRMDINESIEDIASTDPVLGPTTSKRSAKTTVVAKDQETIVIGGIMQNRTTQSVSKVPILGDIPIIGNLFRQTTTKKTKTNLLLFLTPYIIRDQSDFQRIFERKMRERQKFLEEFYGSTPGYKVAIDFGRKGGPFAKINDAVLKEKEKLINGGPGLPGEQVVRPQPDDQNAVPASSSSPAPAPSGNASPPPPAESSHRKHASAPHR